MTLSESDEVKDNADRGNQIEDLDQYLDILMTDQTMSVAKAVKAGDVVVLVPCPHMDHKVDLADAKGFFIMDLADLVRKTKDIQLEYADNSEHLTGCVGYDCTYSLADALEAAECPDNVFCLEGEPLHLARTDSSCDHHPGTTTGLRQVVINLVKLQVEVRKASNRAVRKGENLPILKILGVMSDRPFLPVSLHSGLEFSTLVQGGEINEEDINHLPQYMRQLISKVFIKRADASSGVPSANQKVSVANATNPS